jgi:arginyl-tRNA synthetase
VHQQSVRERVTEALLTALLRARQAGVLQMTSPPPIVLDPPKRPEWGDLTSTVAMALAQSERRPAREVAQIIVDHLERPEAIFERVEIAPPGFLNLTVKRDLWLSVLSEVEAQGETYGKADIGEGKRVLVEFVSANPTGPLHVGHGRGAAVGDAIARLLAANGYDVVKEYYVNDAGRQMKLLGASVYARYRELSGRSVPFPEDGYRGAYIEAVAARVRGQVGDAWLDLPSEEAERQCQDLAYRQLLAQIKEDLRAFGIEFDSWFSESSLLSAGSVERVLEELRKRDLLFEQDGALWFRSSVFGDEKDRVVKKQLGDYTYLASDLAYHRDKLLRGYDLLIDVWGADHHGYIPRMEAVVQAYGAPKSRLRVVLVQMVNLLRGGRTVEMSKRTGEFVTLREVLDEVGTDAAKFFFLMRRSDTHVDFDLELARQQSAENPVYYVQYAHARIASLFRVAGERGIRVPAAGDVDLRVLADPDELSVIRKLSAYPSVVQGSAAALEPHRLTFYLQELAGLIHTFYYRHRIMPPATEAESGETERFVPTPIGGEAGAPAPRKREPVTPGLTAARLVLMRETQQVVRNGLTLLGISSPDRM